MKKKTLIFIFIVIVCLVCALSACIPDKIENAYIYLPTERDEGRFYLGEYNLVGSHGNVVGNSSIMYEVKPGDLNNFLDFFRKCEYYAGEFDIPDTEYTAGKTDYLYAGKKAIWLSNGKFIWICQEYGDKRVRVFKFDRDRIFNEDRDMVASVSRILFSTSERVKFNEEYATPFSWSQLCKFFPLERVNEEEKSIAIDCEYDIPPKELSGEKGTTKIYFNEQNNTITVSSDYVPGGEDV